jgi:hypothetical protein
MNRGAIPKESLLATPTDDLHVLPYSPSAPLGPGGLGHPRIQEIGQDPSDPPGHTAGVESVPSSPGHKVASGVDIQGASFLRGVIASTYPIGAPPIVGPNRRPGYRDPQAVETDMHEPVPAETDMHEPPVETDMHEPGPETDMHEPGPETDMHEPGPETDMHEPPPGNEP